jgi:phosphoribosylformylglycinamidine synthase
MAFAGNCGIDVDLKVRRSSKSQKKGSIDKKISVLFSEELGIVIEYLRENELEITANLQKNDIPYQIIGNTSAEEKITVRINHELVLDEDMRDLRAIWEETSYQLDNLQANPDCVEEERRGNFYRQEPQYRLTFSPQDTSQDALNAHDKPKTAILREEGSNGDREMTSAFYQAGFEVWDVTMTDLLEGRISLDEFRGVAFVGGFSYADVLDSAKGWAGAIRFNKRLYDQFQKFFQRQNTFSLGVCNGCQLMALLGWVPWEGIPVRMQPRFIQNRSGRFESRFSTVRILPGPSILLHGMEDSILGVWVAHGEGRLYFPDEQMLKDAIAKDLTPIRFVDDHGEFTETYPMNPNGSPLGITALCSPDGRHLAMMPHPERAFLKWQWAYMPEDWKETLEASPWLRMFQNARQWCR